MEDCARQITAYLKTVTPPAIAFCIGLILERMPGAVIELHGLTTGQIAATTMDPRMSGLKVVVVLTGRMGTILSVAISLKRDGSLAWKWSLPVEQGARWRKISDNGR